uniref:GH18 domain-containing protein n=1 Tax=Stomoxys calcitrans TaxID=35570 RepID=A0A1I8NY03_STOCA
MKRLNYSWLPIVMLFCISAQAVEHTKMVNCYLGSWSFERPVHENLNAEAIKLGLCTHLSYAFIGLTDAGVLDVQNYRADKELAWIKQTVDFKKLKPKMKVIAVIQGDATIFADTQKHNNFKQSVLSFMSQHNFDGIDLYWVYPDADTESSHVEKRNFVVLLRDLQEQMQQKNLELSVSVSGSVNTANAWHDVPRLFKYVNYVNVLVYNYTDGTKAAHTAPFSGTDGNNVETDIHYWLKSGNYYKLNLGVGLLGRSFKLADQRTTEPGSAIRKGADNRYSPYYEICKKVQPYSKKFDLAAGAAYAYSEDNWVTYENAQSLALKLDLIMEKQLNGITVWSLENDDYRAQCGEQFHLLQFIRRYFNRWYYRAGSLSCKTYGEKRASCYREY